MSLISRYYTKQSILTQQVEPEKDDNIIDEELNSLINEVSYIYNNLLIVEEKAKTAHRGFFENAGMCI
ncbi:MAG: hypothetical protein PHV37_01960 [Candidatus Gastranaerophilales bacterium]|nr:hypothetical protein [Candidatus Gastranaerophilales bacterium]